MMFENTGGFPKAKTDEERQRNIKFITRHNDELKNPCLKEQKLSYQCLQDNSYDKEKCKLEFANYNACQGFWLMVRKDRRQKGIAPDLPSPQERAAVKEHYMSKFKK